MREIFFRGKHSQNNEWVYGYFFLDSYKNPRIIYGDTTLYVIPETVGQYTGLKDKNGVKIFEKDIVSYHHATYTYVNCLIKYEPATASFCLVALHDDITTYENFKTGDVMSLYIPMGDVEVIGNIHDNPELSGKEAEK